MAKKRQRGNGRGTLFKRIAGGTWIGAWYDHDGKRQERSTGTTDKAAAERILAKRVTDAALRREKVVDARVENVTKQAHRPIGEHLADWRAALEAKGNSAKRITMVIGRAKRMIADCRFPTLADVEPARVHSTIREMQEKDAAPRTINGYLQALGQFIRWAVAEGRLAANPPRSHKRSSLSAPTSSTWNPSSV